MLSSLKKVKEEERIAQRGETISRKKGLKRRKPRGLQLSFLVG